MNHRILLSLLVLCLGLDTSICAANTEHPHIIASHANWKYRANTAPPPIDWARLKFDDSHWLEGPAGFGDGDDRTVLNSMHGHYDSVKIRYRFPVVQPVLVQRTLLVPPR